MIYISHPAQFLFFKNAISILKEKGHTVNILVKTKDVLTNLIDDLGWEYYNILPIERKKNKTAIIISLLKRNIKIMQFAFKHKINLMLGTDASIAQVGRLLKIPCITTLEDDYAVIKNLAKLTYPFTNTILVPEVCEVGKWERKKIGYAGYMKLAYLHPNCFKPDINKIKFYNKSPYFLIRLSGLSAHHDFGIKGVSLDLLMKIIQKIKEKGNVYVSSEKELPEVLKQYELKVPVSDIHHYLFFAEMLICDSQSMTIEAAILGTPSVRISSFSGEINVLEELEHKYHLTFGFKPAEQEDLIIHKIEEILKDKNIKEEYKRKRSLMLNDKIDVTAFLVWFIENYPESRRIMKENPDYQYKFK